MADWAQPTGETSEAVTHDFSKQALETGPLKSEAQGLDLSVNIAWSGLAGPFVPSTLLPSHLAILFRNVVNS
jgi:hypothetical protein